MYTYYIYILVVLQSKRTMTEKLPLPRSQLQRSLQLFPFSDRLLGSSYLQELPHVLQIYLAAANLATHGCFSKKNPRTPRQPFFGRGSETTAQKKKKHGDLKSQKPRYHKYLATTIQQKADDLSHNLAGSCTDWSPRRRNTLDNE